jgi:AraC family transcriptional regulator
MSMQLVEDTLGTTVAELDVAGFRLTEVSYGPGLELPAHAHDYTAFAIPVDGTFVHVAAGRSLSCQLGGVLFKPVQVVHIDRFGDDGCRCILIEPTERRVEDLRRHSPQLFKSTEFVESGRVTRLGTRIRDEFRQPDRLSPLSLEALLLDLLATASRTLHVDADLPPEWLMKAKAYLEVHFGESVRIQDAAERAGVSPTRLSAEFRRHFGESPSEYLRSLRVETASRALRTTSKDISRIAFETGFCDQAHLTRVFKRETGVTPGEYRRWAED